MTRAEALDTLAGVERVMLEQLPKLAKLHTHCPEDLKREVNEMLDAYLFTAGLLGEMVQSEAEIG